MFVRVDLDGITANIRPCDGVRMHVYYDTGLGDIRTLVRDAFLGWCVKMYMCAELHTYVRVCACRYVCMFMYVCVCMYVYMYVCVF